MNEVVCPTRTLAQIGQEMAEAVLRFPPPTDAGHETAEETKAPRDIQGREIRPGDRIAVATWSSPGGPVLIVRCVQGIQNGALLFSALDGHAGLLPSQCAPARALRLP